MKKNKADTDIAVLIVLLLILLLFSLYFHRDRIVSRYPWLCGYIGTCIYRYDFITLPRLYHHKKLKESERIQEILIEKDSDETEQR